MFAQITSLRYWKSEHDEATCEDACGYDSLRGVFAVADGAGTTLFSNIWANTLVTQFLTVPLLSDNPFEVEWWVRRIQNEYKNSREGLPGLKNLAWNAQQKVQSEGSQSTLATMRLTHADATSVTATLLVFGDSCVFIHKSGTKHLRAFPLEQESDFDQSPICLPSKPGAFQRYFHRGLMQQVQLKTGDTILLATDAVARWLISAGAGDYTTPYQALHDLAEQTPTTWPQFVMEQRSRQRMVDDDCTALVIKMYAQPRREGHYQRLYAMPEHDAQVRMARKEDFQRALQAQNKEQVAIYYGDGKDLTLENIYFPQNDLQASRQIADALHEVLSNLRRTLNSPNLVASMRPIWQKHASLLITEPCARQLYQTLQQLGVIESATATSAAEAPPAMALPSHPTRVPMEQAAENPIPTAAQADQDYQTVPTQHTATDEQAHIVEQRTASDDSLSPTDKELANNVDTSAPDRAQGNTQPAKSV